MANRKSKSAEVEALEKTMKKAKASENHWHTHKWTKKDLENAKLYCQLPFIRDTRGEIYHADAGLLWWHVTDPEYWNQGIAVGKAFADRVAVVLPQDPKKIEEVLCHSLESLLYEGGSNGIAIGFLRQMAHYACKGMRQELSHD